MSDRIRCEGSRCKAVLCSTLLLLSACFASHGPQDATETGNPPVIDSGRVALRVSGSAVHITGDKSAVTPGGTPIEITNLATGMVSKAKAKPDGSFDVQVDGSPNDAFVVRTSTAQGSAASVAVYVVRGSAAVGGGSDGSLSCAQRQQLAGAQLALAAADADKQCMVDSDCQAVLEEANCYTICESAVVSQAGQHTIQATSAAINAGLCGDDGCVHFSVSCALPPPVAVCIAGQCQAAGSMQAPGSLSCQDREQMAGQQIAQAVQTADTSCMVDTDCATASTVTVCTDACGPTVVSRAGKAGIDAVVTRIDKALCSSFSADGCQFLALPCEAPLTGAMACSNGHCVLDVGSLATPIDCTSCLTEMLEWGFTGSLATSEDHSTLAPCVHYTHRRQAAGDPTQISLSCESDFTACNATTSSGAVLSALANADVQQALDNSPVTYGNNQALDVPLLGVKIGPAIIDVGGSCDGAPPSCIPPPAGVQALVDLLQAIDKAELATPACSNFSP